jgi:4-hydroxyphenylpyruvate dioxygenase
VFYVEACDGERLDRPLDPGHPFWNPEQKPRMAWSRNARLFPMEEGGYLPVCQILQAVCDAGYKGYVAFEVFNRTINEPDQNVPSDHAKRAAISWQRLQETMGWNRKEATKRREARPVELAQAAPQFIRHTSTPLLEAH